MNAPGDRACVVSSDVATERSPALQLTSLKPMEAVASGRLLVANDMGGHMEIILGGATGLLFPPGTTDALATAAPGLLDRHEDWPALVERAEAA